MKRKSALGALFLVGGALFAVQAAAEPGQGAPIVFARHGAATPAPVAAVDAPARFQLAAAAPRRTAAVANDQPDLLYGYGAPRVRAAAPPIDLRGALNAPAASDALDDNAFEAASEPVAAPQPVSARMEPPQPAAAARPDWLERERTGAPYEANGQWYVPTAEPGYSETGAASWYGADFQGRRTASGEVFDSEALTAAHPTLPIPSLVQVTNLENGREVIVRVNDRGPFHGERLIDVSRRTAEVLGFEQKGQARVNVRYLGPAPRRVTADGTDAAPGIVVPGVAAAPPAVAARTQPAVDGAFVVQVGAFSNPANAERAKAALSNSGTVMVDVRQGASGALHRVRLGAWRTRDEAEAARQTVASLGYPGAVVAAR